MSGGYGGYQAQLAHMRATLPLLRDIRFKAKREGRIIVARVLLADDTIATVKAGPRGGLRIMESVMPAIKESGR